MVEDEGFSLFIYLGIYIFLLIYNDILWSFYKNLKIYIKEFDVPRI